MPSVSAQQSCLGAYSVIAPLSGGRRGGLSAAWVLFVARAAYGVRA